LGGRLFDGMDDGTADGWVKDPRRALQRVPTKDLTMASRMVPLMASLKAHSRLGFCSVVL
jgi:hypothetical protein